MFGPRWAAIAHEVIADSINVTYSYTYGGVTYTSHNVFPGQQRVQWGTAKHAMARYEPNETTLVHVDPDQPSHSYLLFRARDGSYYVQRGITTFLSVVGGLALLLLLSAYTRSNTLFRLLSALRG